MTPRVLALLALFFAACSPAPARDPELDAAERLVLERGEAVEDFAALCLERGATERALTSSIRRSGPSCTSSAT